MDTVAANEPASKSEDGAGKKEEAPDEPKQPSSASSAVSAAASTVSSNVNVSSIAVPKPTTTTTSAGISTHTIVPLHDAAATFRIATATVPFSAAAGKLTLTAPAALNGSVAAGAGGVSVTPGSSGGGSSGFGHMPPSAINNIVKTLISTTTSTPGAPVSRESSSSIAGPGASNNGKLHNNHPLVATLMGASSGGPSSSGASNLPTITKLTAPAAGQSSATAAQKIVLTTGTGGSGPSAPRFLASPSPSQLGISPLMPVALNIDSAGPGGGGPPIPITLNSNIKTIPINLGKPSSPAAPASANPVSSAQISAIFPLKPISPLSFLNENATAGGGVGLPGKLGGATVRGLPPTSVAPGASISTGSSAAGAQISNYIKTGSGGAGFHKMTSTAPSSASSGSSSSHTIAQICSNLGTGSMATSAAVLSALQPMRFLPNPSHSPGPAATSTITLTNTPLNAVNVLNSSLISGGNASNVNVVNTTSSPSSSPMKPNIIRKAKRESPAPNALNDSSAAYQLSGSIKAPKFESVAESLKQPLSHYEQISLAASSASINFLPHQIPSMSGKPVKELSMLDHSKNLRKITLTNSSAPSAFLQTPAPAISTVSLASSSSSSSSSSVLVQTTVPLSSSFAAPSSTGSDSTVSSSSSSSDAASRKRRKQDLKKQGGDETTPSYNPNPLSNNNALAYAIPASLRAPLRPVESSVIVVNGSGGAAAYLDDEDAIYDSDDDGPASSASSVPLRQQQQPPPSKIPRLVVADSKSVKTENGDNEAPSSSHTAAAARDVFSDDDACLDDEDVERLSKDFRYMGRNGLSWSAKKCKPLVNKAYRANWKARNNHYLRYSDIKTKDLPKETNTITHRELNDNLNEWKFYYVINQVNNLINYENESLQLIQDIQDLVDATTKICNCSDLYLKINESIKANSQRHRFVNEQLDEVHILIQKLFEHKEKFKNVLLVKNKSGSGSSAQSTPTAQSTSNASSGSKGKIGGSSPALRNKNLQPPPTRNSGTSSSKSNNNNINTRSSLKSSSSSSKSSKLS